MELTGIEPVTPCLQSRCSSQLSYSPKVSQASGRRRQHGRDYSDRADDDLAVAEAEDGVAEHRQIIAGIGVEEQHVGVAAGLEPVA